ncbi:hypothetical protein EVAR_93945_1 [Eumeta japonica]|uniref:Uncharacterized protein n=1 Tax=Eumeta variegata TaxID=151549 RepID=A0A4C1TP59_EUMVA|nr:hypothetical protein EVAR_93945_1 [Eumeta japonica]
MTRFAARHLRKLVSHMATPSGQSQSLPTIGDIERRVNAGYKVNGILIKSISRQAPLAIHNGVQISTLVLYGSKSWVWQKKNESGINAVELRPFLDSMCEVSRNHKCRISGIRKQCGLKEEVVPRVERGMSRWFGHLERMNGSGLAKQISRTNMYDGKVCKDRP